MPARPVRLATSLFLVLFLGAVTAQEESSAAPASPPDCTSEDHRAFDFWVGQWQVFSGDQKAGENTISTQLDGCVLQENWQGAQGSTGTSLNFYDRADKQWHQVWVDGRGGVLNLSGGLDDTGRMVLSGKRSQAAPTAENSADPAGSVTIEHRITWTPEPDGSVNQHWQSRSEGGDWQTLFNGDYRPSTG